MKSTRKHVPSGTLRTREVSTSPAICFPSRSLLLTIFRFYPSKIKKVIEKCITDKMKDKTYDYKESEKLAKEISGNIKEAVKKLSIPRYKIIVQTVIGEIGG